MRSDDEAVDTLRRAHREASRQLDDAPAARVRAAVLAAAARGVAAPPLRAVPTATTASGSPFRSRRWPLSAAALLVVSVTTGLVATHVLRDGPERITTVAAAGPDVAAPQREALAAAEVAPTPPTTPSNERTPAVEPTGAAARKPAPVRRETESASPAVPRASAPAPAPPIPPESRGTATTPVQPAFVAPPPAASPSAQPTERSAKAESVTADSATANDTRGAAEAPRLSAPAAITAMRARLGRTAEPAGPEAWVERIVKLRADGNDVEADRELDALRQRYPGFVVPANALKATGTR